MMRPCAHSCVTSGFPCDLPRGDGQGRERGQKSVFLQRNGDRSSGQLPHPAVRDARKEGNPQTVRQGHRYHRPLQETSEQERFVFFQDVNEKDLHRPLSCKKVEKICTALKRARALKRWGDLAELKVFPAR